MSKDRGEQPACDEISRVEALTFEPLNPEPLNLRT
jgi:hypothetical protein